MERLSLESGSISGVIGEMSDELSMPPFAEGDMLPDIILPNSRGRFVQFSTYVGKKPQVLLFCADPRLPACREKLQSFSQRFADLEPLAAIFGVTNTDPETNAGFLEQVPLPFLLLSDLECQVAGGLGITHNFQSDASAEGAEAFSIVINDINRRVLKVIHDVADPDPAPIVLEFFASRSAPQARSLGHFAPLLYVPAVFEPEFCQSLIRVFENGPNQESGFIKPSGPLGESERVIDHSYKSRRDLSITDPTLLQGIRRRLDRRVVPEIQKAFTRRVTGVEEFKVVRYDADTGGRFGAHRDNAVKHHAHRRFALTLNLNTGDYEGGALLFPEYGPDVYAPGTGDAVVFSCSLLHEATPVTWGRRYALLAFFFDEESRKWNDRYRG